MKVESKTLWHGPRPIQPGITPAHMQERPGSPWCWVKMWPVKTGGVFSGELWGFA